MLHKSLTTIILILGVVTTSSAAEPQGGTLIQMSSIGAVTLLISVLTLCQRNGKASQSKILKAFINLKK